MTSSIGSLEELLQSRESFCATLEALTAAYRTEIGNQFSEKPSSRRETLSMRRRSTPLLSIPTAPEKPMDNSDFQAIAGVLRRIGLSVDSVFQLEEQRGKDDCGENALFDRKQHIVECLRNIRLGAKLPLVAELIPSDQASQLLASALSEDSRLRPRFWMWNKTRSSVSSSHNWVDFKRGSNGSTWTCSTSVIGAEKSSWKSGHSVIALRLSSCLDFLNSRLVPSSDEMNLAGHSGEFSMSLQLCGCLST